MPPSIKYLNPSLIDTPLFIAIIKNIHSTMNKDITVSIFLITPVINIIVEINLFLFYGIIWMYLRILYREYFRE